MINNKKIKKLLHNKRREKAENDLREGKKNDNHLHLRFATEENIKAEGERSALNRIRRLNVRNELNQYEHSDSKHIRLKPYYNAHMPIHWTGIISDITTPHKAEQPEGSILIDKITTEDHEELIDYHLWLNITSIKILKNCNTQKISVGDYIEGISYVTPYQKIKYGLGATMILNCGIYIGKTKPEKIISNYDRGDDWVLTMTNSKVGEKNRTKFDEDGYDFKSIEEMSGHVTCKYQPSRYEKFQSRLISDDDVSKEKPLPLVSETIEKYKTVVKSVYANRYIRNDEYEYVPVIGTGIVYNRHNRIIVPSANLTYPKQLASKGLIPSNTQIEFSASNGDGRKQVFKISKIEPLDKVEYKEIPEDQNALAGYLLFTQNKEGDMKTPAGQKAVEAFLKWTNDKGIDLIDLKSNHKKEWKDSNWYSADKVAGFLHINLDLLDNLVKQYILRPSVSWSNRISDMSFNGSKISELRQIMNASNDLLANAVTDRYHVYRAKDMAKILGISETKVVSIIAETDYIPLNKFYGQKVLKLVQDAVNSEEIKQKKMQESKRQDLLSRYASNPSGVVVKRDIPLDKSLSNMQDQEQNKADANTKQAGALKKKKIDEFVPEQLSLLEEDVQSVSPTSTKPSVKTANNKLGYHKDSLPENTNMLKNWKYNSHLIFKDEKTAHRFASQATNINTKPASKTEKQLQIQVVFSAYDGNYYTDQFANKEEAVRFFESPLKPNELNRFLNATNTENGIQKSISVRHVLEWTFKN